MTVLMDQPVYFQLLHNPIGLLAVHQEVTTAGITHGEFIIAAQQVKRHRAMMVDDSFLADPIEFGH